MADIVSYATDTHEIQLTPAALARLDALQLPGRQFAVAVGREAVYRGSFMSLSMSRSDAGVVILWPPDSARPTVITIRLGYPAQSFFQGEDPRSDPRILEALRAD